MLRRTEWLSGVVAELGLDTVTVHRGRAEELVGTVSAPYVTARAVARLDKLARWCVPLLEPGGTLVAMKGRSAAEELAADRPALVRLGMVDAVVSEHGGTCSRSRCSRWTSGSSRSVVPVRQPRPASSPSPDGPARRGKADNADQSRASKVQPVAPCAGRVDGAAPCGGSPPAGTPPRITPAPHPAEEQTPAALGLGARRLCTGIPAPVSALGLAAQRPRTGAGTGGLLTCRPRAGPMVAPTYRPRSPGSGLPVARPLGRLSARAPQ